jgi:hypothetical protein
MASSTSLPNIDLCFMASITLFSLEEAAKQLDTVVENHFQNSTSSLSTQCIEMTAWNEQIDEWNGCRVKEGEYPQPDVKHQADAHTCNNNAQLTAGNIVQSALRMNEPTWKNLNKEKESSEDLISLSKTQQRPSSNHKKKTNQPFGRDVRIVYHDSWFSCLQWIHWPFVIRIHWIPSQLSVGKGTPFPMML